MRIAAWLQRRRASDVDSFQYVGARWPASEDVRGWSAEDVAAQQAEAWPTFQRDVREPNVLGVPNEGGGSARPSIVSQNAYLSFAYALARVGLSSTGEFNLLDWGGGIGQYAAVARSLFPHWVINYHVAELAPMCDRGRKVNPDVTFHDGDAWQARTYDLVVASGSVQYVPEWRQALLNLAAAGRWLYVARFPVIVGHPSYVMLQRAAPYYDTEYYGWVVNRDELSGVIDATEKSVVREFLYGDVVHVPGAPAQPDYRGWLLATP